MRKMKRREENGNERPATRRRDPRGWSGAIVSTGTRWPVPGKRSKRGRKLWRRSHGRILFFVILELPKIHQNPAWTIFIPIRSKTS